MQNIFKVNNKSTRCHSVDFIFNFEYIWQVVLVFGFFFFFCWLLTFKWQMEYFIALIYIYLCVSESSTMKFYVTKVNNNFQLSPIFCCKELHLRCCIELDLNIVMIIHKNSKRHLGTPPMIEWKFRNIWKTCSPRCIKNTFPELFCFKNLKFFAFNNQMD